MPVRDVQALLARVLGALDAGGEVRFSEVRERMAAAEGLTAEETRETLSCGRQTVLTRRVGGSLTHLRRGGLVERPRRGTYRLTIGGGRLVLQGTGRIDMELLGERLGRAGWRGLDAGSRGDRKTSGGQDSAGTPEVEPEVPYWVEAVPTVHHENDGVYFSIGYVAELGMLSAFAEALGEYARCVACGAPPQVDFGLCPCGRETPTNARKDEFGRSWYRIDADVWDDTVEPLWKKDRRRAYDRNSKARRRRAILESEEISYSPRDVVLLREIQKDACYYCGKSTGGGDQIDHLEPLARGGSNGFSNIVLACSTCNRAKWALSEARFWRKARNRFPPAEFQRVRELARAIKREKRRRQLEAECNRGS